MRNFNILTPLVWVFFFVFLVSCSKEDSDVPQDTIAAELDPVKWFYLNHGAGFKFRVYFNAPSQGDTVNNNNHFAEVYKMIENNGVISVFVKYSLPAISLESYGVVLNAQGEVISAQSTGAYGISNAYAIDEFEIDNNNTRLLSFHSNAGAHGAYGFSGTQVLIHTPSFYQGALSASSNQGYMFGLNDAVFMLSMGLNSNGGLPMFYQYIPSTYSWNGSAVSQIEVIPGSGVNVTATNDASKCGTSDKVFWTWLSYTNNADNGKLNIVTFNYSQGFSNPVSLDGIGSIGAGAAMEYKHSVRLYKNPNNLNEPYIVVRHYNADILDLYRFTGNAIELVQAGIQLPESIPVTSGTLRVYKDLVFTGNSMYLITGMDRNLYKRSGTSFLVDKPELTKAGERISSIESGANGLWLSVVKEVPSKPLPKTVSDVIYLPN